jgi:NADH-quinone oxidoreductase subunit E
MPLVLSEAARRRILAVRSRYPDPQAACLPALWIAQDELGAVTDEAVDIVARELGLPPAHVYGVVTFYGMYRREPVGRHHLQLCTNIACWANGAYDLLAHLEEELGIEPGQTTPDGLFTLSEVECLAACGQAPMMLCDRTYHYDLTREKVTRLLADLRARG